MSMLLVFLLALYSVWTVSAQANDSSPNKLRRLQSSATTVSCPSGYKLVSGYCVRKDCTADYKCPANSKRYEAHDCYNNFDDCKCNSGYEKDGTRCVAEEEDCDGDFACPAPNWRGREGVYCIEDLSDCECSNGYKKVNGYCVLNSCKDDYQCPANSRRKAMQDCYNDFGDCTCKSGYTKKNGKCIRRT